MNYVQKHSVLEYRSFIFRSSRFPEVCAKLRKVSQGFRKLSRTFLTASSTFLTAPGDGTEEKGIDPSREQLRRAEEDLEIV